MARVPEGRRTERGVQQQGAGSPGSRQESPGDLPVVGPARDPGLRASPEQFGALEGGAVAGIGQSVGQFADVVENIELRKQGLARDADDLSYTEELQSRLRELEQGADLSDDAIIDEAAKFAEEKRQEILANHPGGSASKAALANRLERRRIDFVDTLAAKNIAASEDRLNQSVSRRLSSITAAVLEDPDVLLSDDPTEVFRKHAGVLEDEIEFLGLTPSQARVVRRVGQQEIAKTMIEPLVRQGDLERARELLRSDSLSEVVEPATRRDMTRRINQVERNAFAGRAEGAQALDAARTVLGPDASEEDVRAAAQQMVGISAREGMEFFKVGNSVLAVNKKTGALVGRIEGETPEQEADRVGMVERAKLQARREVVNRILEDAGAGPIEVPTEEGTERTQENAAVVQPFGAEEAASEDAQAASRLFLASRRLLLAGETAAANSLLGQARFLMENSPEIQRNRELDKPISPDLAAELGVSIGTTMRDVLGVLPRSPEQRAEATSEASARGRERVAGEQELAFVDQAQTILSDVLDEVNQDPTIVGAGGSLRRAAQTAAGVIGDVGGLASTAFNLALEETDLPLSDIGEMFDIDSPTLSTLSLIENSVGLILARLRTPEGRVPVDVIRRSIDDVKLTGLTSSKQVKSRLEFVQKLLNQREQSIRTRFGLDSQEDSGQADDVPVFRIENGELVPADGGEGGAGGGTQGPFGGERQGRVEPDTVFSGLVERGLDPIVAAGFVGNVAQESAFNPRAVGDNGNAFGLFQMNGPRREALFRFARRRGEVPPNISPETQLDFVVHELQTTEKRAAQALKDVDDPEEAAEVLSQRFFRPGVPKLARRRRAAREFFEQSRRG